MRNIHGFARLPFLGASYQTKSRNTTKNILKIQTERMERLFRFTNIKRIYQKNFRKTPQTTTKDTVTRWQLVRRSRRKVSESSRKTRNPESVRWMMTTCPTRPMAERPRPSRSSIHSRHLTDDWNRQQPNITPDSPPETRQHIEQAAVLPPAPPTPRWWPH